MACIFLLNYVKSYEYLYSTNNFLLTANFAFSNLGCSMILFCDFYDLGCLLPIPANLLVKF